MTKNHPEYQLQKQVCAYLRAQYPHVLFLSDTVAAVRLTMPQAVRNKAIQKEGFQCPDLMIFHPSGMGHWPVLFIELKAETPYRVDGVTLKKNPHIEGQAKTLERLRGLGYQAEFAWSFNMVKRLIDGYFAQF
jgi:hypothetical protein